MQKAQYVRGRLRKLAQETNRGIACPLGWHLECVQTDPETYADDLIYIVKD